MFQCQTHVLQFVNLVKEQFPSMRNADLASSVRALIPIQSFQSNVAILSRHVNRNLQNIGMALAETCFSKE